MEQQAPRLIIVAGANGSGKTTFAIPYTKAIGVQFLNADELAKRYADRGEDNAMIKGGREFFRLLNQALDMREDVVIETTLSGSYTSKVARRARRNGYSVEVVYIFLGSENQCVDRVRIRTRKGGHHVPEEDIRRRFGRSLLNFRFDLSEFADVWFLYYNGGQSYQQVALKS
ncbi:MAG: AAA family ATPase, partial [Bacteroidota bacterium]